MKKFMSLAIFVISWVSVFAQNDPVEFDNNGEFTRVVEVKATAKQAFIYSRAFLSNKIKDYQKAVQVEDAEIGKIQVNDKFWFREPARVNGRDTTFYSGFENYKVTIDCKDNKIRVKVENPTFDYDTYFGKVRSNNSYKGEKYFYMRGFVINKEQFIKNRSNYYISFINRLVRYINKQVEEEDF